MSTDHSRDVIVVPDAQALAEAAAQRVVDRIADGGNHPAVCLTGGSTPKRLYELLATPPWRERIPWLQVHWFIGDDRFVPPDDPLNNMGMARRAFLDVCAPAGNIHAIATTAATPDDAAAAYEAELRDFQATRRAGQLLFDLVLLGVGPDGHTASLFPNAAALKEHSRSVVGVAHANVAPFVPRVSLTLPCLAQTREMLFLAAGHDKQEILRRMFAGEDLPAGHARAAGGNTLWMLDQAAAPSP
ncbi:6-phosphogluconolactonase [Bradyrhizobium prioriisuperbiae]|uniref:6-phosphogluconolactonase n=1 Tax=Bradyrhizobium prioriisuperbiae TaxID=2854389 RepID=UPI0028E93631|nr:6-phosphogluconolactonase [Bradyrhizobium prioritasuperba]